MTSKQSSKTRPSRIRLGRVVSDSAPSGTTRRPESTEDRRVDPDRVRLGDLLLTRASESYRRGPSCIRLGRVFELCCIPACDQNCCTISWQPCVRCLKCRCVRSALGLTPSVGRVHCRWSLRAIIGIS